MPPLMPPDAAARLAPWFAPWGAPPRRVGRGLAIGGAVLLLHGAAAAWLGSGRPQPSPAVPVPLQVELLHPSQVDHAAGAAPAVPTAQRAGGRQRAAPTARIEIAALDTRARRMADGDHTAGAERHAVHHAAPASAPDRTASLAAASAPTSAAEPAAASLADATAAASVADGTVQAGAANGSATAAAIASHADGTTPPATHPGGEKFVLPPSADLAYDTFFNGAQNQSGTIHWYTDGSRYELKVALPLPFIGTFSYDSRGHIDAYGLAPDIYTETRGRRGGSVTRFERQATPPRVSFSRNPSTTGLPAGAQDRFSMVMQLASLVRGDPQRYRAGVTREFFIADDDSGELWPVETIGPASTSTAAGALPTLHFMRLPRRQGDNRRIDIWLAPSLGWLPARIMQTEPNGTQVELVYKGRTENADNAPDAQPVPEGAASDGAVPDGAASDGAASDGAASDGSAEPSVINGSSTEGMPDDRAAAAPTAAPLRRAPANDIYQRP